MKKLLLTVAALGMFSGAPFVLSPGERPPAKAPVAAAQCKYTLDDARAGLTGLDFVGFIPKKQIDEDKVMGLVVYHSAKSADPESVDAISLVVRDKTIPGKELTLFVSYPQVDGSLLIFKREIKNDKLGPCFEKEVEKKSK